MDTGYSNLIDEATRERALAETHALAAGRRYVAGAFIADSAGDAFDLERYAAQLALIEKYGGTLVVMQSYGLAHQSPSAIMENYRQLAKVCKEFIAFELGQIFAPFGAIYDLDTYEHDAAMFLRQRGWLTSDRTHPKSAERPASDREMLAEILVTLNQLM
jgi:hypothetical protein